MFLINGIILRIIQHSFNVKHPDEGTYPKSPFEGGRGMFTIKLDHSQNYTGILII
jgi:hypothetical protein